GNGQTQQSCIPFTGEDHANDFALLNHIGVKALVIDVRANPGGIIEWGFALARAFSKDALVGNLSSVRLNEEWVGDYWKAAHDPNIPLSRRQTYQTIYDSLHADAQKGLIMSTPIAAFTDTLPGVSNPWTGRTFVLVDEMCASTCDMFSTFMQDL